MAALGNKQQSAGRRRRRELASDRRAGRWPRRQARLAHRRFVRAKWRFLCIPPLLALLCLPLLGLVLGERSDLAAGSLLATSILLPLGYAFVASGTAFVYMGESAEQWTAQELRKLARRDWRLLNSVVLKQGDIDHIAIGPGGVLVLESKWTSRFYDPERPPDLGWLRDAAGRTAANAVRVRSMFANIAQDMKVTPAVVVWGPGSSQLEPFDVACERLAVPVLSGLALPAWLSHLDNGVLSAAEIERAWSRLEEHVNKRDRADLVRQGPEPKGLVDWYLQVCFALVGAWTGALTNLQLGKWLGRWPLLVASASPVALSAGGLLLRRWRPLRAAATGWVFGVMASTAGVLVWIAIAALRT